MNPHRFNDNRLTKLKATSHNFPLVICVDFDFTLVDSVNNYALYQDVANLLKEAKSVGFILCVWTANENTDLVNQKWQEANLTYDHFNSSPINPGANKPHFNILLDDSAGLNQSMSLLNNLIQYKKEQ